MLALFGTGLLAVALIVFALVGALGGGTWWAVAASVVYLVGAIGVTGGANVPRNNRLAAAPRSGCLGARVRVDGVPPGLAGVEPRAHVHVRGGMRRIRARAAREPLTPRVGDRADAASAALLGPDDRGHLVRGLGERLADRRGERQLVVVEREVVGRRGAGEGRGIRGGIR